jgi:hypothetical protein
LQGYAAEFAMEKSRCLLLLMLFLAFPVANTSDPCFSCARHVLCFDLLKIDSKDELAPDKSVLVKRLSLGPRSKTVGRRLS